MYRLYVYIKGEKFYHVSGIHTDLLLSQFDDVANQFRTIEAANSKAHELGLETYYIEDEHGQTVYPMKPEITQHKQTE